MIEDLKRNASKIKMSKETKTRIINNCYAKAKESEENSMKTNKLNFKKISIIAAITAVCVLSAGAVISHVRGFRDIVKNGAVVGTEFDEESDMIDVSANVKGKTLLVSVSVVDYNNPPYRFAEEFEIGNYIIVDKKGNILEKNNGNIKQKNGFENGMAEFEIPVGTLQAGEYTFLINDFIISSKADQPLHVNGRWECEFSK